MRPLVLKTRQFFADFQNSANIFKDVNFWKDHRDKIEKPDSLSVEDLISYKLKNRLQLARLVKYISNISEGTTFLPQGVTENDSSFKRYKFKI